MPENTKDYFISCPFCDTKLRLTPGRFNPKDKNKRKLLLGITAAFIIIAVITIISLFGVSDDASTLGSEGNTMVEQPSTQETYVVKKPITVSSENNPVLSGQVTVFNPISYIEGGLKYTLIGGDRGSLDSNVGIGFLLDDSIGTAFTIGLNKGASERDIGNKDELLAFYFKVEVGGDITSPRDIPAADLSVSVEDNQRQEAYLIYNSFNGMYPALKSPLYGIILFATYSDSVEFTVDIGGTKYKLIKDDVKYLNKN